MHSARVVGREGVLVEKLCGGPSDHGEVAQEHHEISRLQEDESSSALRLTRRKQTAIPVLGLPVIAPKGGVVAGQVVIVSRISGIASTTQPAGAEVEVRCVARRTPFRQDESFDRRVRGERELWRIVFSWR
ncbi:MAG TPA: DUF2190 family protein [Bryobacteraceae bacterium]|jgi:hypothetical protein|nr:DUF2190 family protein [Bryobacteraceae bacterium]